MRWLPGIVYVSFDLVEVPVKHVSGLEGQYRLVFCLVVRHLQCPKLCNGQSAILQQQNNNKQ